LHAAHSGIKASVDARVFHIEKHFVAVLRGKSLHHLDTAAMPVHVAEAACVHKNVEAKLLSGAEAAQHFVMLAAMPQAQIDNLSPPAFARGLHCLPNLAIRKMAVLVKQRRRNLNLEWLFVKQINDCL